MNPGTFYVLSGLMFDTWWEIRRSDELFEVDVMRYTDYDDLRLEEVVITRKSISFRRKANWTNEENS